MASKGKFDTDQRFAASLPILAWAAASLSSGLGWSSDVASPKSRRNRVRGRHVEIFEIDARSIGRLVAVTINSSLPRAARVTCLGLDCPEANLKVSL